MAEPVNAEKVSLPPHVKAPPRPDDIAPLDHEHLRPLAGLSGGLSTGLSGGDPAVRRLAEGDDPLGGSAASADVVSALQRRRGRGAPLDTATAGVFGQTMGADLSGVRVHTDSEADSIARSVQAKAFTHGSDVYFSRGTFDTASQSGKHLLAHELTHVVQQQTGADRGGGGTTIGRADDPLETAADQNADRVVGALQRCSSPHREHTHGREPDGAQASPISRLARKANLVVRRVLAAAAEIPALATAIANGHAWTKHVQQEQEFTTENFANQAAFAAHIESVMTTPSESKDLGGVRGAYWDDGSKTVVILNTGAADKGTCFKPKDGKTYYDNLV
ncbi:DUF4157 domain-containing protein [Nocardioides sp.]|uniref:eCIS core domain-containing protein n=1 Tax=Nocardioides sp. TaxID=35761 RepID=UPI003568461F